VIDEEDRTDLGGALTTEPDPKTLG
jgi:hypothetical protein